MADTSKQGGQHPGTQHQDKPGQKHHEEKRPDQGHQGRQDQEKKPAQQK